MCIRDRHLLPANDTHVVRVCKFLLCRVRIPRVHVADGATAQDHVVKGFLEGPHRQIHWPDRKQGQGVDADHDDDEDEVQNHLE